MQPYREEDIGQMGVNIGAEIGTDAYVIVVVRATFRRCWLEVIHDYTAHDRSCYAVSPELVKALSCSESFAAMLELKEADCSRSVWEVDERIAHEHFRESVEVPQDYALSSLSRSSGGAERALWVGWVDPT